MILVLVSLSVVVSLIAFVSKIISNGDNQSNKRNYRNDFNNSRGYTPGKIEIPLEDIVRESSSQNYYQAYQQRETTWNTNTNHYTAPNWSSPFHHSQPAGSVFKCPQCGAPYQLNMEQSERCIYCGCVLIEVREYHMAEEQRKREERFREEKERAEQKRREIETKNQIRNDRLNRTKEIAKPFMVLLAALGRLFESLFKILEYLLKALAKAVEGIATAIVAGAAIFHAIFMVGAIIAIFWVIAKVFAFLK